ncbi:MAG: aminodeoxychorismate synthase [Betaproteobacteria bacterium]|nr:aminodeoxychorismate synthase [Betaproteobacteria bacterium]
MKPIKTLLIDNYDSFTHNLVHLITRVNGTPPFLMRNDEKAWKNEYLHYFDNIVISPGPGRPEKITDFGLCREIILTSTIPVLGVCLGHQGICALHGATIDLAPEPRHGRISPISHHQAGLFLHIPSPFHAVRYHSLAVYNLPEELEPTAWSEDGVIMAVAHRTKPLFGVQFHPESICTGYGEILFRNFSEITRSRQTQKSTPVPVFIPEHLFPTNVLQPPAENQTKKAQESYQVLHDKLPWAIPAEMLFDAIFRQSPHAVWLDNSRQDYGSGRFSIMCDADGPLGRIARADTGSQTITVTSAEKKELIQSDFFDWLEKDLQTHAVAPPDTPFEFALGWAGYIGYEMKSLTEAVPSHASALPDACLLFCDRALVIDHEENSIWLLALASASCRKTPQEWLSKTAGQLASLAQEQLKIAPLPEKLPLHNLVTLRHDKTAYLELIAQCKETLLQGESYEICLTNMAHAACTIDPWTVWRILRKSNPVPYGAFMQLDGITILSCSPERFLGISRERIIESKPIKGTRPRSKDPIKDAQLKEELANSEKERAENLMIVDLVRNDLGKIAQPDSVKVSRLFDIESYQTVHQMVSTVTAKIQDGISVSRCVRAAFPGGSMTGAPKRRTLQILDRLEGGPRGIYSGTLGYFSLCGAADLSIIIRTLVMTNGHLSFGIGGAITALSDPKEEFEEIRTKAQAFLTLFDTDFATEAG